MADDINENMERREACDALCKMREERDALARELAELYGHRAKVADKPGTDHENCQLRLLHDAVPYSSACGQTLIRQAIDRFNERLDGLEAELDSATTRGRELVEAAELDAVNAELRLEQIRKLAARWGVEAGGLMSRELDMLEICRRELLEALGDPERGDGRSQ